MHSHLSAHQDLDYTPCEVDARDATCNDKHMPAEALLRRLRDQTKTPAKYSQIFQILWKRAEDKDYFWHVLKALNVVEYLMMTNVYTMIIIE